MTTETARGAPLGDSGPQKGVPEDGVEARGKWANKTEFLFTMTGGIVGLGNIWRFPYLCFKNGGGAFFIPYFALLFLCGFPLFFLETALGQYTSEGGVTAWRKICPMFEGVGIASQVLVTYLNIYYIVILAWAIFYLVNSFTTPLPWSTCDNQWNTDSCHNRLSTYANPHMFHPDSNWSFLNNSTTSADYTDDYLDVNVNSSFMGITSPEEEFWTWRVLRMSEDMSLKTVHWELACCLLAAWVICYFCIWKGIRSAGKVAYFTATFPYLLMFILFIRGVTLPGAGVGLKHYLMPNFSKIIYPQAWHDAGIYVIYSYAMCQGVLTAIGSYNKYNNNCYKDCVALCCLNAITSIFAGFVVFSVLGFMAHELNVSIEEVAGAGLGLGFMVFPRALSMLPVSSFWAVLFFLLLFFLGLDSQFVCVESLATAITDMFPHHLRRPGRREILALVIAVVCFLLGLLLITEGGILLFYLLDTYGPSASCVLFIACFETIVIAWVYGANRFYDNIQDMIGYQPFPVLKYCWLFVTPLICWLTLTYELQNSGHYIVLYNYHPGPWASVLGALLTITPLMCIPAYIVVSLCRDPKNMKTPSSDLRQAWPHKPVLTLCGRVIFHGQQRPPRAAGERDEKMMMEDTSAV